MTTPTIHVHTAGTDPVRAVDRTATATESMIPWLSRFVDLFGARVFEYGAGRGTVSRAFAEHAAFVHGVDIDPAAIRDGTRVLRRDGIENVSLEHHPPEEIIGVMSEQAGHVDLVLLYAVVEHLSIVEREQVLHAALAAARPDGLVAIVETPNRLHSFDGHSSQLPYFNWLPNDLARRYVYRSTRQDLHAELAHARSMGADAEDEWWVRFGTGVSFHEFELALGDPTPHILAGGYETLMWPARPLQPGELLLSRDLARQRPDLGPAWSRQWLDLVLSPEPRGETPPLMRPWIMDTRESEGVSYTRWDTIAVPGPAARVRVRPERPTQRAIVGFSSAPGATTLSVTADGVSIAEVPTYTDVEMRVRYVELAWDDPADLVELAFSVPTHLMVVAYAW